MRKVRVNGALGLGADPVFEFLKAKSRTGGVYWNFYKFVVSPDGREVVRFTTAQTPAAMAPAIEAFLAVARRGSNGKSEPRRDAKGRERTS
jgi:glutathione peroxidase-family protein